MAINSRSWRPPARLAAHLPHGAVGPRRRLLHRRAGHPARGPHRLRGRSHPAGRAQPALPGGRPRRTGGGPYRPQHPHPPTRPADLLASTGPRPPAAMSSRGSLQRNCVKGHPRPPAGARAAASATTPDSSCPAPPTAPAASSPWAATPPQPSRSRPHRATGPPQPRPRPRPGQTHGRPVPGPLAGACPHRLRARTVASYTALLRDHVRPQVGARPLKQLTRWKSRPSRPASRRRPPGRPAGRPRSTSWPSTAACTTPWPRPSPGGWSPATSPPAPPTATAAPQGGGADPEQVALLLAAADHSPSPWLGPWTTLAAATGTRNGELCGLEWADLDLDAGTVRFQRPPPSSTQPSSRRPSPRRPAQGTGGRPVKPTASSAILTLPAFAVQALRQHRPNQARWCLACGQPRRHRCDGSNPAGRPGRPSSTV
jgi:hypothetical protein